MGAISLFGNRVGESFSRVRNGTLVFGKGRKGLDPGLSTETRKRVFEGNPADVAIEKEMHLGQPVDRPFHIGQGDVDVLRVMFGFAEERGPAAIAEASRSM